MHTHFSAMNALNTFLAVLIVGTAWRLVALRACSAKNPTLNNVGTAMYFQY